MINVVFVPLTMQQPLEHQAARSWTTIAMLAGLILTVVAFSLAVYQVYQSKQQSRGLKSHESALGAIAGALSTRYIGPFPDYLPTVVGVVDRATSELLIVNANPTPAYFSAPLQWVDYRRAVASRIHSGVSVTLISASPAQRLKRMHDQFAMEDAAWPAWRVSHGELLQVFLAQQYPDEAPQALDLYRFLEMLVETQGRLTAELFGAATRIEVDGTLILQVWIRDMKEAVFTIETTAQNSLSHGLYTSDTKFVSALYAMAELYRSSWAPRPGNTPKT